MEVINLDPGVKAQLTKLVSVRLCAPVPGQALLDLVVNPPQPDEPSHATFMKVKKRRQMIRLIGNIKWGIKTIMLTLIHSAAHGIPLHDRNDLIIAWKGRMLCDGAGRT